MIEANPYDAAGYQVLKIETHLHTLHSDGRHSVDAMFEACRAAGYDAVALTDHNTQSGVAEARAAADRLGLVLVPGVEVTTFRGHAVALGVSRVPEWRDLETRGIDALARDVHTEGGLLTVAHAAAVGSPVCSGCTWQWPIEPESVDLWETFSAPRPITEASVALWRHMLVRGAYVAPVAAGDVHSVTAVAQPKHATHVFVRERTAAGVLEALRARRLFASAGPRLDFWLEAAHGTPGTQRTQSAPALAGSRVSGPAHSWIPHMSAGASVGTIKLDDGRVCLYAERRTADQSLEAISAPIWIDTAH
jgi:hypothetical protein